MNLVSVNSGLPSVALPSPTTRILPVGRTRAVTGKKPPASAAGGVNFVIPLVPNAESSVPSGLTETRTQ